MTRVFIDTNVLCYAYDQRSAVKRAKAESIIKGLAASHYAPVISTQVLQEFYNALTRKLGLSSHAAKNELLSLENTEIVQITPSMIYSATDLHANASVSFWDSLIIISAQTADCDELWTEDFQTGRKFGKLQILNPFE